MIAAGAPTVPEYNEAQTRAFPQAMCSSMVAMPVHELISSAAGFAVEDVIYNHGTLGTALVKVNK